MGAEGTAWQLLGRMAAQGWPHRIAPIFDAGYPVGEATALQQELNNTPPRSWRACGGTRQVWKLLPTVTRYACRQATASCAATCPTPQPTPAPASSSLPSRKGHGRCFCLPAPRQAAPGDQTNPGCAGRGFWEVMWLRQVPLPSQPHIL